MTDILGPDDSLDQGQDVDPGQPIEELSLLAREHVEDITDDVVDEINMRTLGGQILKVQWWGMTVLLREYLSFILDRPEKKSAESAEFLREE